MYSNSVPDKIGGIGFYVFVDNVNVAASCVSFYRIVRQTVWSIGRSLNASVWVHT